MNKFCEKIASINSAIEDAKLRFKNEELFEEDILEFFHEEDLNRYITEHNYEKTEFIKENIDQLKVNQYSNITSEDKELITKIIVLMDCIPSDFHKCIGCPCLENDYPSCHKCIFYQNCISGNRVYPNECYESDCYRTFAWMNENEEIVKKALNQL